MRCPTLHIRLLVPTDLSEQVLALLDSSVGVTNISLVRGAARSPAGDLVEFDAARPSSSHCWPARPACCR